MPMVAGYVESKEQNRFNSRVIKGLGVLNAQVRILFHHILISCLDSRLACRSTWFQCSRQLKTIRQK